MPEPEPSSVTARLLAAGEWLLAAGLAAALAWTTLCLGGYRPETMVVTSAAVFGLAALGGLLWALRAAPQFNLAALLPVPFLLFALASTLWISPARWLAWREWLLWLQAWLVFALLLHHVRRPGQAWLVAGVLVALGLAGAAIAAWQRFHDPTFLMLGRHQATQFLHRSAGMFGIPNSFAGLLELLLPVCLTLAWSRATPLLGRVLAGWLAAVLLFALALTGSRGGWLAVFAVLVLWPLSFARGWRWRIAGGAAALALAAGLVAVMFYSSAAARGRIRPFLTGEYEASRPILWRAGLELWRQSPWLGTGAASYNVLFDQHRPPGFLNEPQWAHNEYVNTLSDYGVVGFGLWAAAGAGLAGLGWRAIRRVRRERGPSGGIFERWRWRQGLWLGLAAFAIHLSVDFHTRIPALAFAAAAAAGWLLRDDPALVRPAPGAWRWLGPAGALAVLAVAIGVAAPLYRAEALRYGRRQDLDRVASGPQLPLDQLLPAALVDLQESVKIDPANGQAWADLSWATELAWHVTRGDLVALGRRAGDAADTALRLCPVMSEFHVRKGVALDMQGRPREAAPCFREALALAPNRADWHFAYAYHLSAAEHREADALAELESCLALDHGNFAAVALRERLKVHR